MYETIDQRAYLGQRIVISSDVSSRLLDTILVVVVVKNTLK